MEQPYNKASTKHFRPLKLKSMFYSMLLRRSKIQRLTSCNCFLKRRLPKVKVILVHLYCVLHFLAKLQKIICHDFLAAFNWLCMNFTICL